MRAGSRTNPGEFTRMAKDYPGDENMTYLPNRASEIRARVSVMTLCSYPPAGATVELKGELTNQRAAVWFKLDTEERESRRHGLAPNYTPQLSPNIGSDLSALEMMLLMQVALETWERLERDYVEAQRRMGGINWQGAHGIVGVPAVPSPEWMANFKTLGDPRPTSAPAEPASCPKPASNNPDSASCPPPSDL